MSIKHIDSVLDDHGYRGSDRLVLIVLAKHADDGDYCWPKQETIAKRAGCSVRSVVRAIARLVNDGIIRLVKHAELYRNTRAKRLSPRQHGYRLTIDPNTPTCHVPKVTTCQVPKVTPCQVPNKEELPVVEPSVGMKTSEPAARTELPPEDAVAVGQLPEDEPVSIDSMEEDARQARREQRQAKEGRQHKAFLRRNKKADLPKPGTYWWVYRTFTNEATKCGHPEFNVGLLGASIKRLRDGHDLSYDEIDELVKSFFVRERSALRGPVDAAVLFRSRMGQLVEATESSRANMRRTGIDPVESTQAYWGKRWEQIQRQVR